MRTTLRTEDLGEIITVRELPDGYIAPEGIREFEYNGFFKGIEGKTRSILMNGICISITNMRYPIELTTYLESDAPHLEMHFELKGGNSFANKSVGGMDIDYATDRHALYYFPELKGNNHHPIMEDRFLFEVEMSVEFLSKALDHDLGILGELGESIKKGEPAILGNRCLPITLSMKQAIHDIIHCPYTGRLKKLFLEGKVLELLSLQIAQYQTYLGKSSKLQLHNRDIEKLHYVKSLVDANLSQPYSLLELSKLTGLNNFKLKEGFKELFDNTVFGYLSDVRLEKAKVLLQEGKQSIAEISYITGYRNPQHFTVAFKKKFGYLPRDVKGQL